ncbi:hypothetical protein PV391_28335, partial [Streptomyces scabiei]|nr:hypothetical protein [Streptomyces scabiei]
MKDTPGWASPGSAPSGGQEPDPQGSARPEDRTDADRAQPADQAGPDQAPQQSKWSKEQPPPAPRRPRRAWREGVRLPAGVRRLRRGRPARR